MLKKLLYKGERRLKLTIAENYIVNGKDSKISWLTSFPLQT